MTRLRLSTFKTSMIFFLLFLILLISVSAPLLTKVGKASPVRITSNKNFPIILFPEADTYVSKFTPDLNFGGEKYLIVSGNESMSSGNDTIYLSFDLKDVSIGFDSVKLHLVPFHIATTHRIVVFWCPDSFWEEDKITRSNSPLVMKPETVVGPISTLEVASNVFLETCTWDVTSAVKALLSIGGSLKMTLFLQDENGVGEVRFFSKEGAGHSSKFTPYIEVVYSFDVEQPTIENLDYLPRDPATGDEIHVTVSVTDDNSEISVVRLCYSVNDGSFNKVEMTLASNSTYEATIPKQKADTSVDFYIEAFDNAENEARSNTISFKVSKVITTLSCSASIKIDETVIVSGSISPVIEGVSVTLTYTKPNGTTFSRTVTTGSDGSYSDSYKAIGAGSWNVFASWDGNDDHIEAFSPSVTFLMDIIPPNVFINFPTHVSTVKSSSVTVTWSGSDTISGINYYRVKLDDGIWLGAETSYTFMQLSDGSHTVYVKAVDKANNLNEAQVSFTVNTSFIGGPGWIDDIVVFIIVGLAVVTTIFLIRRRRRKSTPVETFR